MPLTEEN